MDDKMKIEIWSDIACPYCYIGKRKLEKALDKFAHKDQVQLVWHSYELDPDLPKKALSTPFYKYFAQSHGMTEAEVRENNAKVVKLAKEVGLDFDFDKLVVANTSSALRLVKLAKESGLATEAEEILFSAYFVEGKDISDQATLIELGVKIGLKEDEIVKMFKNNKYSINIEKDMEYSENELNLEYIPFYLFNNKHIVQGSIATDEYLKLLESSYDEWKQNGVSKKRGDIVSGQSCSIDGVCN